MGRASRRNNQRLKIGQIQTADKGTGICVALGRYLDAAISARRCQFGEGNLMVERKDEGEGRMRNAVFSKKEKKRKGKKMKSKKGAGRRRRRGEKDEKETTTMVDGKRRRGKKRR